MGRHENFVRQGSQRDERLCVKFFNWYLYCFTSAYFTRPRVVLFEQQFCVSPVACGMVFMFFQKGSNSLSIDRLSQHLDIL